MNDDCKLYSPVSLPTYSSSFWETYSKILDRLRKERNLDSSKLAQAPSISLANEKSISRKKPHLKKLPIRKLENSTNQPTTVSASRTSNLILMPRKSQQLSDQSRNSNVIADNGDKSAIYYIPTSRILTNANITNNIVEMVHYI